ncbi:MAG: glycosyltransferase family 4 protein [Anaerolineaceae bacterium]|nr:glycosyltransferase family 4 protein [Anaerolineaceae bacterium]
MVIISNGFSKFHLSVAAAEADRRQLLSSFLTGAYPTPLVRKILSLPYLRTNSKAQRLATRREKIDDGLVHALFCSEALNVLGMLRRNDNAIADAFRFYGRSAIRHVEQAAAMGARIYHYRAGFGGASIEVARKLGMYILCDYSLAHPSVVEGLVANGGKMPRYDKSASIGPYWRPGLSDIEQADAILANSHFVEETFKYVGHDGSPTHVIYLGVDDSFLAHVPQREDARDELRLLYAGNIEKRKGVEMLMDALARLDNIPWRLEIAGPVLADVANRSRSFFADPRVNYLGLLSRENLATAMTRADVFVFPSLAEGSARVVFEALACGCYVITTPNSGSIVENGVHGGIVQPGDSSSLREAIEYAYQNRDKVLDIGRKNALCVRAKYRQSNYGDQLSTLYKELLDESKGCDGATV